MQRDRVNKIIAQHGNRDLNFHKRPVHTAMKLKFSPCGCSSSWVENVSNKKSLSRIKNALAISDILLMKIFQHSSRLIDLF